MRRRERKFNHDLSSRNAFLKHLKTVEARPALCISLVEQLLHFRQWLDNSARAGRPVKPTTRNGNFGTITFDGKIEKKEKEQIAYEREKPSPLSHLPVHACQPYLFRRDSLFFLGLMNSSVALVPGKPPGYRGGVKSSMLHAESPFTRKTVKPCSLLCLLAKV